MLEATLIQEERPTLAGWAQTVRRSALQEMLTEILQPDVLSFALGLPAPEFFPTAVYAKALAHVLANDSRALQYGAPFQPLKAHIVSLMSQRGVDCGTDRVFLTSGAQQGISLVARMLLDVGDTIVTEAFCYPGFQQVVEPFKLEILTVPTDVETGIDVNAVEVLLRKGARPKLLYTVPHGHNPLGASISSAKRERLVELARQYRFPIIEDDPYGFLYYDGISGEPLRALDEQWVFYVGTFSKILAPALRVGWIITPREFVPHLSIIKESSDIDTSTLSQRAISRCLDEGFLQGHVAMLRREYACRRDVMLDALRRHFPSEARWSTPSNGLFIWVELPTGVDSEVLLQRAVRTERIAFLPGHAFSVKDVGCARNCIRLNFSNSPPPKIEDGIARLGQLLQRL